MAKDLLDIPGFTHKDKIFCAYLLRTKPFSDVLRRDLRQNPTLAQLRAAVTYDMKVVHSHVIQPESVEGVMYCLAVADDLYFAKLHELYKQPRPRQRLTSNESIIANYLFSHSRGKTVFFEKARRDWGRTASTIKCKAGADMEGRNDWTAITYNVCKRLGVDLSPLFMVNKVDGSKVCVELCPETKILEVKMETKECCIGASTQGPSGAAHEVREYIYNREARSWSDDELIIFIQDIEDKIKTLESVETKSENIKAKVKSLRSDADAIVAVLDARVSD